MILLDGKATAAVIRKELGEKVGKLKAATGKVPGLAVILVGEDPASAVYVRNKERACVEAGIFSKGFKLDASTSQHELEKLIRELNRDDSIHGILLQLPVPEGLDSRRCLELIDPDKDVDGFHPVSVGRLTLGLPGFRSCTPAGVMTLLERYGLDVNGKKAVVIGRSNIVGKPLALMLLQQNATVTVCHSRTASLADEIRSADYIFAAVGRPRCVTGEMVKDCAVVVDVGINRTESGLVGDCDFKALEPRVAAMTPVPGGVGPMTITQLLINTVQSFEMKQGL